VVAIFASGNTAGACDRALSRCIRSDDCRESSAPAPRAVTCGIALFSSPRRLRLGQGANEPLPFPSSGLQAVVFVSPHFGGIVVRGVRSQCIPPKGGTTNGIAGPRFARYDGGMSQGEPEYRHPRWLLWTAACGAALAYGCVFAAANVLARPTWEWRLRQYGWPLVYMERQKFARYQWLAYPSSITSFKPGLLLVDVLCGILLSALAAAIVLYWLRRRHEPLQFSLRSIFLLTTVVAVCLGVHGCVPRNWYPYPPNDVQVWLALFHFLVNAVPILLAVTAAHRATVACVNWRRRRCWLGTHWITWLAMAAIGGPLLHYSLFSRTGLYWLGKIPLPVRGWPHSFPVNFDEFSSDDLLAFSENVSDRPAIIFAGVIDVLVWFAALAAIGLIIERWIRRIEASIPIRPGPFLLAAIIAGLTVAIITTKDGEVVPAWYDCPSWLLGIVLTLYAAAVLVSCGAAWCFGRLRARPADG
jgi:hypothetical protein